MKPSWMLVAAIGLSAGSAVAQPLIAPSRQYGTAPSTLDKSYGMPTFGMPGADLPRQKTMAPPPQMQERPDPFKGLSTFATPPSHSSSTPDFFQNASGGDSSDIPDFFAAPSDSTIPKARKPGSGGSSTETPLMTTGDGSSTGDTTSDTLSGGSTSGDSSATP
jgi:hypothetical protein